MLPPRGLTKYKIILGVATTMLNSSATIGVKT
nr:MAG TPA: hypothetical protein [Caudoviricetes sp.]